MKLIPGGAHGNGVFFQLCQVRKQLGFLKKPRDVVLMQSTTQVRQHEDLHFPSS